MPVGVCEVCGIFCFLDTHEYCIKCYKLVDRIANNDRYNNYYKKWRNNNPEKKYKETKLRYLSSERRRKLRRKNPYKIRINNKTHIKARNFANKHKLRRNMCLLCLLKEKVGESYAFHHTDYESNLGFSVCKKHHIIADRWLK